MSSSSFETKFGQLSDTQIHEKAPVLAPYKVGFQLIDKNDDETRAVGVMAYNINGQWIYVPCFWIDGQIKGYDLMYLKQQDMFLPLQEAWVNYVKSKRPLELGNSVEKKRDSEAVKPGSPGAVSIYDLGYWGYHKRAEQLGMLDPETIPNMLQQPSPKYKVTLEEWLPKFGKAAAASLVLTMKKHPEFSRTMLEHYAPSELTSLITDCLSKKAEETKKSNDLIVITTPSDPRVSTLADGEKEALLRDRVYIKDNRKNTSTVFYDNISAGEYETPRSSSVYDVLMADGSTKRMGVIIPDMIGQCSKKAAGREFKPNGEVETRHCYLVDVNKKDNSAVKVSLREVLAKQVPRSKEEKRTDITNLGRIFRMGYLSRNPKNVTEVQAVVGNGNALRSILGQSLADSGWFAIIDPTGKTVEGKITAPVKGTSKPMLVMAQAFGPEAPTLYIEPTGNKGKMFIKGGCLYIPRDARVYKIISNKDNKDEGPLALGSPDTIRYKLMKEGAKLIKLYSDGNTYMINDVSLDKPSINFEPLSKTAALVKLATEYGISAPDAKAIIKEVTPSTIGRPMAKRYFVKLAEEVYGYGNVAEEGNDLSKTQETINTRYLDSPTVDEVLKKSQAGSKEVLDISVLNSLVKRNQVSDIINQYVGDLTKAVDRIGRLLFLFYWHNDSFKDRYGSQEMYDLENSLKDVLDAVSDLVLFLKEKTILSNGMLEDVSGDLSENLGNA